MSRQTSHSVRCDNPPCPKFVDVENGQTPEGWYNVRQADEALRLPNAGTSGSFDVCSLKCMGQWSKARAQVIGENGTGRHFAKEKCAYCDGEFAPQGMRKHILDTHGEEALEMWREDRETTRSSPQVAS